MTEQRPPDGASNRPFVRGMSILAGAIVVAALIGAGAVTRLGASRDELEVTGSTRRAVASDLVVWSLRVSATRPQLADALRDVTAQAERVRTFLRVQKIPDSAIVARPLGTGTVEERLNGNETGRISAYRIAQQFVVTSRDVAAITAVVSRVGELVNQGVPVDSDQPEYLVTRLPELRVQMLADAVKDARARADQIAAAAGAAVGRVKNVRVGVFQVTAPNSTSVSDYGGYDTGSRDKDVTVTVRVTFAFR